MKLEYFLVCVSGAVLAGCSDPYLSIPDPNDRDGFHRNVCYEYTNGSRGKCTSDLRPVFSNYVTKRGQVYWMEKTIKYDKSCYLGAMTFFFDFGMWRCLKSGSSSIELIESRRLVKVATYSPAFQALKTPESTLVDWQHEQLANYAKDKKAVYFKNIKIEGADPNTFAVIFPFGNDEIWKKISVSRSGKSLFLRWKPIENIEFNKFRAYIPVRCPGNGVSCVLDFEDFNNDSLRYGIFGSIDNDVFAFFENGISRFPGMATPDTLMFRTRYTTYLYSREKFYELSREGDKLLDMDIEFYERYKQ